MAEQQRNSRRGLGAAAAGLQGEAPTEINPHIPQFISQTPWYIAAGSRATDAMTHQRAHTTTMKNVWYKRGTKAGPAATKFRKGACTNCGALTHAQKDCVERPRKVGAKYSGVDFAADEVVHDMDAISELSYDAKRDRWNGYDPREHDVVAKRYEIVEEERRRQKEADLHKRALGSERSRARQAQGGNGDSAELDSDSDSDLDQRIRDEDFIAPDDAQPVGVKRDERTRQTVRRLAIREDTAKYLRNLDVNSAYYDPKSRSLRENPTPGKVDADYIGDNFVKMSGDAQKFNQYYAYAFTQAERGQKALNLTANPTLAERSYSTEGEAHSVRKQKLQQDLLSKYGGSDYLMNAAETTPGTTGIAIADDDGGDGGDAILFATEKYTEYTRDGNERGRAQLLIPTSRWEEDVHPGNHVSVWGSWYSGSSWGYACCHSTTKGSYCTGRAGIEATDAERAETAQRDALQTKERDELRRKEDNQHAGDKDRASGALKRLHVDATPSESEEPELKRSKK